VPQLTPGGRRLSLPLSQLANQTRNGVSCARALCVRLVKFLGHLVQGAVLPLDGRALLVAVPDFATADNLPLGHAVLTHHLHTLGLQLNVDLLSLKTNCNLLSDEIYVPI
jgi:hypothetical protein